MAILIEAAIDSAAAAERAVIEGAGRLEVCADLDVGGLTPSLELLAECLALGVPCVAMARPRAGDFIYGRADLQQLMADVATVRDAGAHGVVFGTLASDSTVDREQVIKVVTMCPGFHTVFHRAFDETPDACHALETLIECDVTRVLTSGHADTAADGVDALAALVEDSAGRIEVLPGGGIRAHNVAEIVRRTGAMQVHCRGTEPGIVAAIARRLTDLPYPPNPS